MLTVHKRWSVGVDRSGPNDRAEPQSQDEISFRYRARDGISSFEGRLPPGLNV